MGMFSGLCNECGISIKSNAVRGDLVKLFLLKDGVVLEEMAGQYTGYGTVFEHEWDMPWDEVCRLDFLEDRSNGLAYIHERCYKTDPVERSKKDPDQGWG